MAGHLRVRPVLWVHLLALISMLGLLPACAQAAPRVIPDGVYKGTMSGGTGSKATSVPLTFRVQGKQVTGHASISGPMTARIKGDPSSARTIGTIKYDFDFQGVYTPERGAVSGKISGKVTNVDKPAGETGSVTGTFRGEVNNDRLAGTGTISMQWGKIGASNVPMKFSVDLGEPEEPVESEAPLPPERIALNATIEMNPSPPKPGDQVELWATVTGPDGKVLSGAQKIWDVGNYGGNVDPRFTWDGKELLVKLTVVHENNEYKFTKTIPAYVEETPAPEQQPTATPAASETKEPAAPPAGGGSPWGPAAIIGAVVAAAAGVIGLAGALIGRLRRPPVPRVPRQPVVRQPVRRPPPPPPRPPAPPPPPPHPPRRPHLPPPPPPPGPPNAPAGTTGDKPPEPPASKPPEPPVTKPPEPPEAKPPETKPPEAKEIKAPDEEPEDEKPEGQAPVAAAPATPPAAADPAAAEAVVEGQLNTLRERMQVIIEEATREGYYIRNPDLIRKVWHNFPVWEAVKDWATGSTGGHCGEAADWGAGWLTPSDVETIFGAGTTYDTVLIQNGRSSVAGYFINHIANRVTLPDGRRYIVDFWEGLVTGQSAPAIIPEAVWVARWTTRCNVPAVSGTGGNDPVDVVEPDDKGELLDKVRAYGQEWGVRRYLDNKARDARMLRNPNILTVAERRVRLYQTYRGGQP